MAAEIDADTPRAVEDALELVPGVRSVSAVLVGDQTRPGPPRPLIAIRVGVSPALAFLEVTHVIAEVKHAVSTVAPTASVFVEPHIMANPTTPTEAIVIRGAE